MTPEAFNQLLDQTAMRLDLPEPLAAEAVLEYEAVADWLSSAGSSLAAYVPNIYPQGSFRLGTPVRPSMAGADFDIDLVCRLALTKDSTTQLELKTRVGDRLREDKDMATMLEEKRRCWTLKYPGRFHLDILPAIGDSASAPECILIPDRDLFRWQPSNPIGYSDWFFDRMGPLLLKEQERLAGALGSSIEEIPRWRVRTPLQRAVQLLKRHRDVHFNVDNDRRPASIILTTLAARAYQQERDTMSALLNIVRTLDKHIEYRKGDWWVSNPAQPRENFADRWNEDLKRREAFIGWLRSAQTTLDGASTAAYLSDSETIIERALNASAGPAADMQQVKIPPLSDARHAHPLDWPLRQEYNCSIKCWVHPRVRAGKQLWRLQKGGVPKNAGLRFVAKTDTPPPYVVYWQIVNTGVEAAAARQLRGGFESSEDGENGTRWERTAFAGTHWVEALVVKNGSCVARSGRLLVQVWPNSMASRGAR